MSLRFPLPPPDREFPPKPDGTLLAGIDGCPGGWLAILYKLSRKHFDTNWWGDDRLEAEPPAFEAKVVENVAELFEGESSPEIATIDIPIGLVSRGDRECDKLARKTLGPRRSSVFTAPIRPILGYRTYQEALAASRAIEVKGISVQAFGLYSKIKQVDELLRTKPELRNKLFEIHPELSFGQMQCMLFVKDAWECIIPLTHSKHTVEGREYRHLLVARRFGDGAFASVRSQVNRREAKDDDILDAFAALWTARRIAGPGCRALPKNPVYDEEGLEMAMYA